MLITHVKLVIITDVSDVMAETGKKWKWSEPTNQGAPKTKTVHGSKIRPSRLNDQIMTWHIQRRGNRCACMIMVIDKATAHDTLTGLTNHQAHFFFSFLFQKKC